MYFEVRTTREKEGDWFYYRTFNKNSIHYDLTSIKKIIRTRWEILQYIRNIEQMIERALLIHCDEGDPFTTIWKKAYQQLLQIEEEKKKREEEEKKEDMKMESILEIAKIVVSLNIRHFDYEAQQLEKKETTLEDILESMRILKNAIQRYDDVNETSHCQDILTKNQQQKDEPIHLHLFSTLIEPIDEKECWTARSFGKQNKTRLRMTVETTLNQPPKSEVFEKLVNQAITRHNESSFFKLPRRPPPKKRRVLYIRKQDVIHDDHLQALSTSNTIRSALSKKEIQQACIHVDHAPAKLRTEVLFKEMEKSKEFSQLMDNMLYILGLRDDVSQ